MNRRASIAFVFVTLAIDAIGVGIIIPVLPDVVRRFITDPATVSRTYGAFIAIYALLQFLSSPLLGRLSDRYGRRPVLLLSLVGGAIDYVFMAFAPTLPLLFLGRVISGISGASFTVAGAYIADISDDSNRSKNFGVIGAGFGIGFVVGPAVGGLLASRGLAYPFLAAAAFNCLNFLFGLFVLPESLPPEKRRAFDRRALNPFRALATLVRMPAIATLVAVYALISLAGQTHPSIWTLYTEYRYAWTPSQVGLSLAVVGVLSALSQGALTGIAVKRLGERRALLIGVLGEAIGFACFGLVAEGWMIYVVLVFSSLFWAGHPALQSLITREIPPESQGELQGALMSIASLTSVANPLIMTALFAATTHRSDALELPGSPYFLASAFFFAAWAMVLRWSARHHRP